MARKKSRVGGQNTGLGNTSGGQRRAATPLPPQNPYVQQAPPIDPQAEAYNVSARRNVALGDADATYQNARIENQYGLGADQSNPYNDARMLEDAYLRNQSSTKSSYASRGLQGSGAYKQVKAFNERNYSIGYDRLARDYQDAKYGVTRGQLQSYADYGVGVDDARFQSILRGLGG
jgi:lambda family phage tail tape measure protein